jgi:hypothetical protein
VDEQQLFDAARDDLQAICDFLMGFAEGQVRDCGAFLPFGVSMDTSGKLTAEAASDGEDQSTATEILPLLHEGLRTKEPSQVRAVGVCEWVKITPEGGSQTDAIKVLVEHTNGLTVAFYLPMKKKMLGKWEAGELMLVGAEPEVGLWSRPA